MAKSSPVGDAEAFRKTVLDYLKAELATAEAGEREDLLAKAVSLLQIDHAFAEVDAKLKAAKEIEAEQTIDECA